MKSVIEQLGWHEWLCHTNFSFLRGASHPKDLIQRAHFYGYRSLSITDYDGVYGIARAYREREKMTQMGTETPLRLQYGAEIHLQVDHELPLYYQDTLTLLAQSHKGYHNLCQLLTFAHRDGKHNANVPLSDLLNFSTEGLIAIQPMRGLIRRQEGQDLAFMKTRFGQLKEHFKGELYFAISRHLSRAEDHWIEPTLNLAHALKAPVLLSQDAFFHASEQKKISDLLMAMHYNKTLNEASPYFFVNSRRCLHSLGALEKLYSALPVYQTALQTSHQLATTFDFDLNCLRYQYPKEMLPKGYSPQQYLVELTWYYAYQVYGNPIPDKVVRLLQHELCLIEQLQFADYFLTVYDIVRWARSKEILCQGRGSAANSAVCYVLGITSVNPDNFELLFERFMSAERGDPPDIDVDFEHERREEVIQYIYRRYGRDRAAMVCNVICFKTRGALRFVGKALGFSDDVLSNASSLVSDRIFHDGVRESKIDTIQRAAPPLKEAFQIPDHQWQLWVELSQQILGFPRHIGIHSGGFMLTEKSIDWLCPREPATMEGRTVVEWCKEDIEGLGFFKIDVLALGMLTAIRKCFDLIQQCYGYRLSLASIPENDLPTYQMIQKGDTVGVFQIESRAQVAFLPRHRPQNFYDLVVQVAIIRPGPIQGGMIHPYLKRRFGLEPVDFPDPRLKPILERTYGVPIFQEQVMRVAMAVGGFSPGEANELRKNIGGFNLVGNVDLWLGKVVSGMRANGIAEKFIEGIMGQIKGFASYGFPESHSASFALLVYASSYLKCHFPAAFYTAILNSQPMGFYRPDTLLKTAQKLGVSVLPICVHHSRWDHQLERLEAEGSADAPPVFAIRLGMRLVRGLSKKAIEPMTAERDAIGGWEDLESLLRNCRLSRTDLTALAASDALVIYGVERKMAIWLAEAAPYADLVEMPEDPVTFEKESLLETAQLDYQSTSTSLGEHPAFLIKTHAWVYTIPLKKLTTSEGLKKRKSDDWVTVFGMVTCRQSPETAKGMVFITLWDETGSLDLAVRPQVYQKFHEKLNGYTFLCASGVLQSHQEAHSILVNSVHAPQVQQADIIPLRRRHRPRPVLHTEELVQSRNYR